MPCYRRCIEMDYDPTQEKVDFYSFFSAFNDGNWPSSCNIDFFLFIGEMTILAKLLLNHCYCNHYLYIIFFQNSCGKFFQNEEKFVLKNFFMCEANFFMCQLSYCDCLSSRSYCYQRLIEFNTMSLHLLAKVVTARVRNVLIHLL